MNLSKITLLAAVTAASQYYTLTFQLQAGFSDFRKFFPACLGERLAAPILSVSSILQPPSFGDNGDDRDRTGNLWLAKPTLSQLSYVPGARIRESKSQI